MTRQTSHTVNHYISQHDITCGCGIYIPSLVTVMFSKKPSAPAGLKGGPEGKPANDELGRNSMRRKTAFIRRFHASYLVYIIEILIVKGPRIPVDIQSLLMFP